MALTADIKLVRYGTPGNAHQPLVKGITATVTIYRGSFALLDGVTHKGYLKNAASPASADICLGMVANAGPGVADTAPGITGGATDGAVQAEIATGSFIVASGTGADQLDVTTNGTTVYLMDEKTVGKTTGGGTRPVAGIQLSCPTDDASIPTGFVAIKVGTPASPLGGP